MSMNIIKLVYFVAGAMLFCSLLCIIYSIFNCVINRHRKRSTNAAKYIFTISAVVLIICIFICIKLYVQLELVGRRNYAIDALRDLSLREQRYYSLNRRYASTFEELGLNTWDWQKMPSLLNAAPYAYSINKDYYPPSAYSWEFCTASIKRDNLHIYAYYCTKYGLADALSIDFNGNIKVIKSAAWPLPGP